MKAIGMCMLACAVAGVLHAAEPALKVDLGSGASLELILIPAGSFRQGSPPAEPGRNDDETPRDVRLTQDYYVSRTSITRGQWERFVAETGYRTEAEAGTSGGYGWDGSGLSQRKEFTWRSPGFAQDASHPVCMVTFPDAQAFCRWLESKSGRKTTLPTEAQWEYACRAGTTTAWHSGNDPASADRIAWHKGNAGNGTRPAASTQPNAWGLHIGGNVAEWCLDWFGPYPAGSATDPLQQNSNLSDKARRVLRGGSWTRDAKNTRSAARFRSDPRSRNADIGFRVVCATAEASSPVTPPDRMAQPLIVPENRPQNPTQPAPEPAHAMPPSLPMPSAAPVAPAARGISFFSGLLCLLVPVGFVVFIVLVVKRRSNSSTSTNLSIPLPRLRAQPKFRVVEDGFWIDADWAPGTPMHLQYIVGGLPMEQRVAYQPGDNGQFIFTGQKPRSMTASPDGEAESIAGPPPLSDQPPPLPAWDRGHQTTDFRSPPHRPSAY